MMVVVISAHCPPATTGADIAPSSPVEFSGTLLKRHDGRRAEAQVYVKGDRLRLEYKYAIKTAFGYSSIEIIRPDKSEVWYVLPQRRELLAVPLRSQLVLPVQPSLPGEVSRTLIGDATAVGRPAQLFEVTVDVDGRRERFYEWVDVQVGVVLKLVSQDRDWSFEYKRLRLSAQPDYYFDEPAGYSRRVHPSPSGKHE